MARKVKRRVGKRAGAGGTRALAEASRLYMSGDFAGAYRAAGEAAAALPNSAQALSLLGTCEARMGLFEDARGHLERAIAILPREVSAYPGLTHVLLMLGDAEGALEVADRYISQAPEDAGGVSAKASVLRHIGKKEEASALVGEALGRGIGSAALALEWSRACEDAGEIERGLELLVRYAQDESVAAAQRISAMYRLGEVYEKLERYEDAWKTYVRANGLSRKPYDRAAHDMAVDGAIRAWKPEADAPVAEVRPDESRVVFILGMPRSGTSLVEQVLAAHPGVCALGETAHVQEIAVGLQSGMGMGEESIMRQPGLLSRAVVDRARSEYFAKIADRAGGALVVTEKLPGNYANIGLITRVFPDAVIVHCVRDPLDTCLSCYFHSFGSAIGWAYDISDIAHQYRAYERFMAHWRDAMGVAMHEVVYEDFVADQERGTRALLEAAGLEWDEACLRFHEVRRVVVTASTEQVNKPVYRSSVKRWERFAPWIGALREGLEEGTEGKRESE